MPAKTDGTHDDIVFATMVPGDIGGKACFQHLPGVNLVQAADVKGGLMLANAKATPMIGKETDRNGYIKICLQWPCYDEPHVECIELGHGSSIMTLSLVYQVAAITCEWFKATRKARTRSNGTYKEWKVASKETSDGVHENHMVLRGLRHIGREYWVPILYWNPPDSRT
ncbi:hypothetical protein EWM64_g3191 [Hericium alpestre]|uniref:Uncharacterized protein n=1 Tax=Hericium alpestre TaxID=135208 RepID=A0A4Z0A568_9AGAM|nr:hypothetical protein EWM64_g3191 [Hericium alpestre]